jgi:hypothetical protein
MVRSSSLSLMTLGLSSAICLLSAMSPSFAAKPEQLNDRAMGTKVDCRGAHSCASWLTTNFAGKRPLAMFANDRSMASIAPLGRRSVPGQGPDVEEDPGPGGPGPTGAGGDTPTDDGGIVADDNNGHGNDPGHVDDSNPGNSSNNQNGGADNSGPDNGNAGGAGNNGNNQQPGDNGHGNDPGHSDSSNPGKGK